MNFVCGDIDKKSVCDFFLRSKEDKYMTQMNSQPLRRAIRRGDLVEVKAIIEAGFPVNGILGELSPLQLAVELGKDYIIQYLLSAGADPNQKESSHGNTPLHIVTLFG